MGRSSNQASGRRPKSYRDLSCDTLDLFAWARSGAAVTPRAALTGEPATQARRSSGSAAPPHAQAPLDGLEGLAGDREAPSAGGSGGRSPLVRAAKPPLSLIPRNNSTKRSTPVHPEPFRTPRPGLPCALRMIRPPGDLGLEAGGADQREAPGPSEPLAGQVSAWSHLAKWTETETATELLSLVMKSRRRRGREGSP